MYLDNSLIKCYKSNNLNALILIKKEEEQMPIIDISGFTQEEEEKKQKLRRDLQGYFQYKYGFGWDSTFVTFLNDDTVEPNQHVMARMYSKSFMKMNEEQLQRLCDEVIVILETAGHPFNEAFPIPVLAMKGRYSS